MDGGGAFTTEWTTLAVEGALRCDAYAALPASGQGTGLLVLHDMFGITPPFRALAEGYARRGMPAMVPNQFWRSEPSGELSYDGGHERAGARIAAFDFHGAVAGLQGAIDALRRSPRCNGKVMALGFCFSGRLAFLAAARTDVDAAVSFYALGISRDLAEAARIACPLQLHYGLADEHVPIVEVDAVAAGVAGNANVTVYRYEGAGHSFFNPVRPMYDATASALASCRIDALLARIAP
ncbi:MAG TPA: dienelactone hydrolase family protein [Stellaceae bacterium]|nr:dienelactone hydrolase family protein [Stellaceae bacterium]